MNFYILTLFPEMVMNGLSTSITGRAIESGKLHIEAINIRDYTQDKHNHVDDYPYGGGAGMVMQAQPVYEILPSQATQSSSNLSLKEKNTSGRTALGIYPKARWRRYSDTESPHFSAFSSMTFFSF